MIHRIYGHAASSKPVAHIDKPAAMRAQTVQDKKYIGAFCNPAAYKNIASIKCLEYFGSGFYGVGFKHLAPVARGIWLVEHK